MTDIINNIILLFSKFGLLGILLMIIIYLIINPEKAEKLHSLVSRLFIHISSRARKSTIAYDISSRVKTALKTQVSCIDAKDYLPDSIKIEWVREENTEAIIKEKKVIIRMGQQNTYEENYVRAINTFVSKSFVAKSRVYINPSIMEASDLIVMKRLIGKGYHSALKLFNEKYYNEYIKKNPEIEAIFKDLITIDDNGIFFPILINEFSKIGQAVYPREPDPCLIAETKSLMRFLKQIAEKSKDDKLNLEFNESYFKLKVILAITSNILSQKQVQGYIQSSIKDTAKGIETIYILALGKKSKFARIISEQITLNNLDILNEKSSNIKNFVRSKEGISGICIELSTTTKK